MFSYLFGTWLCGRSWTVISDHERETITVECQTGRTSCNSLIYASIPAVHYARAAAKESHPGTSLEIDGEIISNCLGKYITEPELVTPLEYLLRVSDAPLEMRGALASIALKSLTKHFKNKQLIRKYKLLISSEKWAPARMNLRDALIKSSSDWEEKQRAIILQRIGSSLNQTSNDQKLMKPFEIFEVKISEHEKTEIQKRNRYLHDGRILDLAYVGGNKDAWKEAYENDISINTEINKLFLKYLGYRGVVSDWGARGVSGPELKFALL